MKYIEVMVAEVLATVELRRLSLRLVMEEYCKKWNVPPVIRGVMRALSLAILRNFRLIDAIAEEVLSINVSKIEDAFDKYLMRIIVYESKYRGAPFARIRKVSRKLRHIKLNFDVKMFNSLREISEERVVKRFSGVERLAVLYSQPSWVVSYFVKVFGLREAIQLLKSFNRPAPLWIRVNTNRINREELVRKLRKRGYEAITDDDLPDVVRVTKLAKPLSHTPEFKKGYFYIQDKASVLVGHVLSPRCGELILDACAAPGSKATHIVQLTKDRCLLIACDISLTRILFLKEYCHRNRIKSVDIIVANSLFNNYRVKFDKILLDPDCSSLGRLGHSPEIRLWITKNDVHQFSKLQISLLRALTRMLKKNGTIVYSTCTLTLEENELNISKFLEECKDVEIVEAKPFIGEPGFEGLSLAQRLLPHKHMTQGFFIAKLVRTK